jgi:hypothetical protein
MTIGIAVKAAATPAGRIGRRNTGETRASNKQQDSQQGFHGIPRQ